MLINTVILFLRDALPIFVAIILLLSLLQKQAIQYSWIYYAVSVGVGLSFILLLFGDELSRSLDDTGREWFYAGLYLVCYCLSLLILGQKFIYQYTAADVQRQITKYSAIALIAIVLMLNGGNFLIYITGFWHQSNASNVLTTGVVLGIGICASIAVLLYFLIDFIKPYYQLFAEVLLAFFSTGLLMQASNLLLQIDVVSSGNMLWDSNDIVIENSEFGHLLTAFFGYDATPTFMQVGVYLSAIFLALSVTIYATKTKVTDKEKIIQEAL